jgi:hypothetical protein
MNTTFLLAPVALLFSASHPSAGDLFVDDDGGPGVDYTDIQPAIDAAFAGDVIHVAIGQYSGFTLTKPLTIAGDKSDVPFSKVSGPVLVDAIPAGATARLIDLWFDAGVELLDSAGTLLGENVTVNALPGAIGLTVEDCDDVRVYRSSISGYSAVTQAAAILVRSSRVELVQTRVTGAKGPSVNVPGGPGIVADLGAELFVTLCEVDGGLGWNPSCPGGPFGDMHGGDGGDAVHVLAGADVTISGAGEATFSSWAKPRLFGGWAGGCEESCAELGEPGRALRIEGGGIVRHSATPLWVGDTFLCSAPPATHVEPGGVFDQPVPIDPSFFALNMAQASSSGDTAKFELRAEPGALTWWAIGSSAQIQPVPGILRDLLIVPAALVPFGQVPPSGAVALETAAPIVLPPGTLLYVQALVVDSAGPALTNSNFLYVR